MAAQRTGGTERASGGRRPRRRGLAMGLGAALAVTAGVVAVDVARAPQAAAAGLTPFTSCEELAGWYRDSALEQVTAYGLGNQWGFAAEESVGGAAVPAAGDSATQDGAAAVGGPVGSSETGTNVQEEGVDEPSRIKVADGVAWTLSGSRLVGVDIASGTVVGDLELAAGSSPDDGTWFSELVLVGDRVVVVGSGSLPPEPAPEPSVPPSAPPSSAPPVGPTVEPTTGPTTAPSPEPSTPPAPSVEPSLEPVPEPSLEPDPAPEPSAGAVPDSEGAAAAGGAIADQEAADSAVDSAVESAVDSAVDSVIGSPLVPWYSPTTTATTVDVGDPSAPVVVDRVEVEGGYVSARASGGAVRLVTTSTPSLPFVDPWLMMTPEQQQSGTEDELAASEDAALARNQDVVRGAQAADWLPDLVERADDGTVVSRTPVGCDTVAHPGDDAGNGTLSVLTLDPAAEQTLAGTTSVAADGSVVYASTDRLYVATTRGGWLWGWGGGGGDPLTTQLHGFDTTDPRGTTWLGSGSVEGWLLGSWAMDAHDGHLRVGVTSESPVASGAAGDGASSGLVAPEPTTLPSTTSSVVVLRETADGLVEVGRVDDLGPTETIRSLRWFDDLAVVVTFRQTDPLYTVDLADPTAPRVLGELKVTGYSGYLHPVGDGMLLGVGQEADTDGTTQGTKVETYDVSDLSAPAAVSSLVWPQSSSAVEWDSRLFAYLPGRRTAVLPLERYDADRYSSGLVAVGVGTDGAVAETGSWSPSTGEGGGSSVTALASTPDLVLVTQEGWQELYDDGTVVGVRDVSSLVVLDATDLSVRAEVPLGQARG